MSEPIPQDRLWELDELYRGRFPVEELSYGTVRDLADSLDNLGGLARASGDMKDLQRCWMVKAVLGTVEPGGQLIEIGAGEPLVAGLLTRLGYSVTVVDPYDGSDQGPVEFERFQRDYPEVDFIRDRFPPSSGAPGPGRRDLLHLGARTPPGRLDGDGDGRSHRGPGLGRLLDPRR